MCVCVCTYVGKEQPDYIVQHFDSAPSAKSLGPLPEQPLGLCGFADPCSDPSVRLDFSVRFQQHL